MKWVTDRIGKEQIWYSDDVINKIESICRGYMCDYDDCYPDCECVPKLILDIIESEDK